MLGKRKHDKKNIIHRIFGFSDSLFEPASKVWTRFVEGELRITDKIQQQIMHVGSVCISSDLTNAFIALVFL